MHSFEAKLQLVGINPYVRPPAAVLRDIFAQAGRSRGPVPVRGTLNGKEFRQTLVRFRGAWRLYVNTSMLKNSPKRIGETVQVRVGFDPADRSVPMHPAFETALNHSPKAKAVFENLPPSRRKEIVRYIANLKSEEAVQRNIVRAISFLHGKARFVGRDRP